MSALFQDVRFAVRLFARSPGMTVVAVLSLALATGPNAALFSIINGLFFQDLGVEAPDRLISIGASKAGRGELISRPDYEDLARLSRAYTAVVAWERRALPVSSGGFEEMCPANAASANYFVGLGVKAAHGRVFLPELDESPASDAPAVISYSLWQRKFGGRREVVGESFQVLGRDFVVIGVAPRRFRGLDFQLPVDVWIPFGAMPDARRGNAASPESREKGRFEIVVGRLRPEATLEQAQTEAQAIAGQLAAAYPATNKNRTFAAWSYGEERFRKGTVLGAILLGVVSLVLLVACANVAGLLLAQAEARRKEVAVRLSLGAPRARLIRQFLTESLLLSFIGTAAGLLLGYWLLHLPLTPPLGISFDYDIHADVRVFAYAILLTVIAAVVFGLLPALQASKHDLAATLKGEHGVSAHGRRSPGSRSILVAGQIAVSQFLLAGTAVWLLSYLNVQAARPGFDPSRNVLFAQLAPTDSAAHKPLSPAAYQELLDRVRSIPGIVEVSGASVIPLSGSGDGLAQKVLLPGDTEPTRVRNNFVSARYFAVMGTRLLRGRDFDSRDAGTAARSVIVNETLAYKMSPDGNAVGRWLRVEGTEREVIGVVEDGKYSHLREAATPYMFLPSAGAGMLAIATAGPPAQFTVQIQNAVSEATPQLRVLKFVTLEQNMQFATYVDRMAVGLFATLGLLGIFLAAVGLYGMVAQSVYRRTHEIGIRMALGALPRDVFRMVLGDGLRLAAAGMPFGLAAAVLGAMTVSKLLFGVRPLDPLPYLLGSLPVLVIALFASHLPARRAARVDPADALRNE